MKHQKLWLKQIQSEEITLPQNRIEVSTKLHTFFRPNFTQIPIANEFEWMKYYGCTLIEISFRMNKTLTTIVASVENTVPYYFNFYQASNKQLHNYLPYQFKASHNS